MNDIGARNDKQVTIEGFFVFDVKWYFYVVLFDVFLKSWSDLFCVFISSLMFLDVSVFFFVIILCMSCHFLLDVCFFEKPMFDM